MLKLCDLKKTEGLSVKETQYQPTTVVQAPSRQTHHAHQLHLMQNTWKQAIPGEEGT